jgi:GT2 family glycosyltransferase
MITISYITSRPEPRFDWFFDSLNAQLKPEDDIEIVIIDFQDQRLKEGDTNHRKKYPFAPSPPSNIRRPELTWTAPKPTVWQGLHRLPADNWWAAANARNTALCLARGDWWACVDDRCVLQPGWMDALRDAVKGNYAVIGPYQKRTGVTVENGVIKHGGIVTGEDNRLDYVSNHLKMHQHLGNPYSAPGEWFYGCSFALPVEWALKVNGFDETCDSSSGEDYIFGLMLQNNGFELRFDTRMMVVEDRTPEFIGPPMYRKDKGKSPNDKSHALLAKLGGQKRAQHPWDIRAIRTNMLKGGAWPKADWPVTDWYDRQPVKDFTPP